MSDIAELRHWLENEVDAGDEAVQVWADKAKRIEEQLEAKQRELDEEIERAVENGRLAKRLHEQLEATKRERDEYRDSRRRQAAGREAAEDRDRLTIQRALRAEEQLETLRQELEHVRDGRILVFEGDMGLWAAAVLERASNPAKEPESA